MKKIHLFCLVGALLVIFPVLGGAQANREAVKLAREGAEALKSKDWNKAVDLYRSYIYEVKGDVANCIADCDKVLQMQRDNAEAKARKQRMQTLQAQQSPTGPITPPPQTAPPKKP